MKKKYFNVKTKIFLVKYDKTKNEDLYLYTLSEFPNTKNELKTIGNKQENLKPGLYEAEIQFTMQNKKMSDGDKDVWVTDTKVFINTLVEAKAEDL
jgi:hypothetical protein